MESSRHDDKMDGDDPPKDSSTRSTPSSHEEAVKPAGHVDTLMTSGVYETGEGGEGDKHPPALSPSVPLAYSSHTNTSSEEGGGGEGIARSDNDNSMDTTTSGPSKSEAPSPKEELIAPVAPDPLLATQHYTCGNCKAAHVSVM